MAAGVPLTDRPQDYVRGLLSDAGMKDIRLALFPGGVLIHVTSRH
jgi:hypothetical protein